MAEMKSTMSLMPPRKAVTKESGPVRKVGLRLAFVSTGEKSSATSPLISLTTVICLTDQMPSGSLMRT